jgi:sugar phosphate permease
MAFEKRRMLARTLELVVLVAIIVAVWLVMIMPVVIYFLVSVIGTLYYRPIIIVCDLRLKY